MAQSRGASRIQEQEGIEYVEFDTLPTPDPSCTITMPGKGAVNQPKQDGTNENSGWTLATKILTAIGVIALIMAIVALAVALVGVGNGKIYTNMHSEQGWWCYDPDQSYHSLTLLLRNSYFCLYVCY